MGANINHLFDAQEGGGLPLMPQEHYGGWCCKGSAICVSHCLENEIKYVLL